MECVNTGARDVFVGGYKVMETSCYMVNMEFDVYTLCVQFVDMFM
jgi:hypothetical protein